jgi:putative protease
MEKKLVGRIKHYFDKIGVAVIELSDDLKEGESISIEGHETNIQQAALSMQIDKKPVQEAHKGQSIGLKVEAKVREGDKVFKVEGE